ncbi:ribokinase [Sinorhizobium meliloti]|uniref:ribokinase n=1 Tax=Rhizobium meliloti TaxID=382 RepID=UPI000FD9B628|nr:ribokinase [Sinorhizobium meliloti]MDE3775534.1 ribokinase [Sinorhizobium meliloti]RVG96853.1 ribokinase [Sinorhizobium meliloti]RVK64708.1 ribokinase [Sinorhizobium meliloti]
MIITFGSINADLIFTVEDIPQPGQTLLAEQFRTEAGGKGANQAIAAARDGATVVMAGAVGQDALAEVAMQNLIHLVDVSRVGHVSKPTGCASILIDRQGRNMIAVAPGANLAACSDVVDDSLIRQASVVLLQMENDAEQIARLIQRVKQLGGKSILNLAPAIRLGSDSLSNCDLIVVNENEAEVLAGWLQCEPSVEDLSGRLNTGVLRTLGANGAEAFVNGEKISVAAIVVDVIDSTAAGDCFVGVLASALDRGLLLRGAMNRAVTAAGIVCSRKGSQSSIPLQVETDRWRPPTSHEHQLP